MSRSLSDAGAPASRPRVIFVHPAIRQYRGHIYQALQTRFRSRFFVLGVPELNTTWAQYFGLRNVQIFPDGPFLPYGSNVSWRLIARAWREEYDIWVGSALFAFSTHAALPIVKARRRLFVLWTEDWYWGDDRLTRLAKPYCRWILSRVDLAIAAGSKQAEFLQREGVPADRIVVATNSFIPLGSGDATAAISDARVHRRAPLRVLYLGRLLDYKGPEDLIRAYAKLDAVAPRQTELWICGQGPAEDGCRRLVAALGLERVRFVGRVNPETVAEYYAQADVFVHPCRWNVGARVKGEAWGFVINEAMACGLPVVTTTAVAAARDLIEDGVSGFVVAAGDTDQLAERLIRLHQQPELRWRMGRAARHVVEERFRPEMQARAFCDALEALYERRTCSGSSGSPPV